MAGYRPPYSLQDDKKIIKYLLDKNYGKNVKGDKCWVAMEEDKVCVDRTWQSLKNRYLKKILPDLGRPEYGLTQDEITTLKIEGQSTSTSSRNINPKLLGIKGPKAKATGEKKKDKYAERPKESEQTEEDRKFFSLDMSSSSDDTD